MAQEIKQEDINRIAFKACDTFRGALDPAHYKDYILVMLFVKYISDLWEDKKAEYEAKYKGDQQRVERALLRERFIVPEEAGFKYLHGLRNENNIGELINIALEKIEDANKKKLENVFRNIDFNSESNLGETKDRNRRLKNLLEDFANPSLDLRPSRLGKQDIIGNTYEYLIHHFASDAGKKGGEFYTPPEVATLLAKLVEAKAGDRICDPTCGSGSLLIRVGKEVGGDNFALYGQESNGSTWALCRMNMLLHDMDSARIEWCNTITSPRLVEGDRLMKFNVVVANPPFSLKKWGDEAAETDKYNRFWRGIPPQSKGDYAFISHMIETSLADEGKVGVVVPHGVLFRGAAEGKIRQKLVEENLLKAVIGLPPNLFFGAGISAALMIFDRAKKTKDVLFIDASKEFQDGKKQNKLREEDINKILQTYKAFKTVPKYAHRATLEEIAENDFNLNIPRYVDNYVKEPEVDIVQVQKEIKTLEVELAETRKQMDKYLKELGYGA
jgi:type I restriction enzyme M protein